MKFDRKKSSSKKEAAISPQKKADAVINEKARHVTGKDLETVLNNSEEIQKKFEKGGPLGRFVEDFKLLIAVLRDYWKGNYRKMPFWTIAAIVVALLYVLNPFDIIPDAIPGVGLIDDAAVMAACLAMIRQDLHNYKEWKAAHPE